MIDPVQSKLQTRKLKMSSRANRFVNYRPRVIRNILLFALRVAMKLVMKLNASGWDNIPHTGPVIMMINHIAFLDPVILTGIFPRYLISMAKVEAIEHKVIGPLIKAFDAFPVNRGAGDRQALRTAFEVLDAGLALLIAPEGHRSEATELGEAHEGIAFVASRAHVPIVPVAISGTEQFKHNIKRLKRTTVTYRFGQPFYLEAGNDRANSDMLKQMTDEAMYQLSALLPPEQRGLYANLDEATAHYVRFINR
ncbi:MAG: 1-acyl-sn-glycerol-3-phosphate acyltransferase [Thermoflexales bacterium]|nr:1-acyl-sn-glycerol-3-phosphate acyltransferase [Thermoflexales bacterium]